MDKNKEKTLENVYQLSSFDSLSNGIIGDLVSTELKLTFFHKTSTTDIEIYYANISYIMVYSHSKKKIIKYFISPLPPAKEIEIYCSDFSVHKFRFTNLEEKSDSYSDVSKFLEHLVEYAFPDKLENSWAFESVRSIENENSTRKSQCLSRLNSDMSTYHNIAIITRINENFNLPDSVKDYSALPPYFLVLKDMTSLSHNNEFSESLKKCFQLYEDNHGPIISCYLPEFNSILMRSSRQISTKSDTGYVITSLKSVLPYKQYMLKDKNYEVLFIHDLNKTLPDIDEVQKSRDELQALCQCTSKVDFLKCDKHWSLQLEKTRWIEFVSKALSVTKDIVSELTQSHIPKCWQLIETGGRDWNCVISSLVQIAIFPKFRKREGFQSLIQKEWVLMGHPFPIRCGHIKSQPESHPRYSSPWMESVRSPMFPLFIDCVFQMVNQQPYLFEFSQDYLVFLMDASFKPHFIEFSFTCEKERCMVLSGVVKSVWNWDDHLPDSYIDLLDNPMYKLNQLLPGQSPGERDLCSVDILSFSSLLSMLQLWRHAYFRWMPYTLIENGGYAVTAMCQRQIYSHLSKQNGVDQVEERDNSSDDHFERRRVVSSYPYCTMPENYSNLTFIDDMFASFGSQLDSLDKLD